MPNAWPLVFAVLLAGCGGGGGASLVEGSSGTVAVSFSNASGFNGNTSALNSYTTLDGSVNGSTITLSVINGSRSLDTSLISPSLVSGATIDLSGSTGSVVVYTDTTGTWGATSGTVTIVSRTSTGVQLQFTNVVLTSESGGATGSVTLSGTASFVAG